MAEETGQFANVRGIGTILAWDFPDSTRRDQVIKSK